MPFSKFVGFLKENGIISKNFTTTHAQIIFTKVMRNQQENANKGKAATEAKNDKLDINTFTSAMTLISQKFYPDLPPQQALNSLTTDVITKTLI